MVLQNIYQILESFKVAEFMSQVAQQRTLVLSF